MALTFLTRTRSRVLLLLMACALMMNACSNENANENLPNDQPSEVITPEMKPDPTIEVTPIPSAPLVYAPYTGLAWKEGEEEHVNQRPIAVMINNERKARPQSGLPAADVLIEIMAEGGVTRIVAIYHSQLTTYDGEVGPVRSIRPYLIELGESYGAMLVHAGASNDGYRILQRQHKEHLDEISNAGPYFWRDQSRKAPHNLYTNLDKLNEGLKKKGYSETAGVPALARQHEQSTIEQGTGSTWIKEPAEQIDITFYKSSDPVKYQYDSIQGNYIRYVRGEEHIDKVTNHALRADNILVVEANHKVLDDVGRLEVDLNKPGAAVWLYKGEAVKGEWIRQDKGPIQFTVDGKVIELGSGNTHIMVVPNTGSLSSHASWK